MQIKKTLGILLAVCFLMSVTAAAVSANQHDFKPVKPDPKKPVIKIEKTKVKVLFKVVDKKHHVIKEYTLFKYVKKINGHFVAKWFKKEWVIKKMPIPCPHK